MANKIKYGLRNVHYSKITIDAITGVYSYATPVAIPGAVNIALSGVGDTNDFFADDTIYHSITANQGYEGDLQIAILPDSFMKDILGLEEDANGALVENADAQASAFALGFEVQGDDKGRKTWLYNCKASRPNQEANTTETGVTPSTDTLSLKAMPRLSDKNVKVTLPLTTANTAVYSAFFNTVYEESTPSA